MILASAPVLTLTKAEGGDTTVEVAFPSDHPILSVSVKPLPGWTYTVQNVAVLALAAAVAALVRGRRAPTTEARRPT